jgi:hypothetical protein
MIWRWFLSLVGLEPGDSVVNGQFRVRQQIPDFLFWLLVVVGLAMALVNFLPQLSMRLSTRIFTFFLRCGMFVILLAVLCGLEWHVTVAVNEKPRWTVLVDDSASMATRDVAESKRSRFSVALEDLDFLRQRFADSVDLTVATFSGQPLKDEPGEGPTLFVHAIGRTALARGQVDRLIVLTDGRDSEGRDLLRLGEDLKARDIKLTIALYGSDKPLEDSGIAAEPERNVLRLGEELLIRGSLTGQAAPNETLTLKENTKVVKSLPAPVGKERRFEIRHRPTKKGQHVYTVDLSGRHLLPRNNTVRFTVQVVEEKINVLLIEGFPRFEFKLFKTVLEVDPLVKLVSLAHIPGSGVHVQGEPLHRNPQDGLISSPAELFKYDVIILRDVPRSYFRVGGDTTESRLQAIVQFVTKRGGGLMVTGGQDVYRAGRYGDSALAEILPFDLSNRIGGQDQFDGKFYVQVPNSALDHALLQLLPNAVENRDRLKGLPQLDGSNNVGGFKPLATPLLTRRVKVKGMGDVVTEKETPIMAYMAVGEGKVLATAVDTMWQWQLQPDFEDPPLTMLLANAVRYLAPPPGHKPGQPSVTISNPTPQVGQDLELATDLRDPNYDPIQNADLLVTVTRPDGSQTRMYPRDLPEEPGHYAYRVHLDQGGAYKATAKFGKFESTREFVAGAAAGEFADLSVDRPGMTRLAVSAEGEVVASSEKETSRPDLAGWLTRTDVKPTRRLEQRELEVWNSPLALLLFLGLLCTDCYIRKRQGLA